MSGNSGVVRESTTPVALSPDVAPVGGSCTGCSSSAGCGGTTSNGSTVTGQWSRTGHGIWVSIPLSGDYSTWKRGRGRQVDPYIKKHKIEFESPGAQVEYSVGSDFTPHVITVNAGEGRYEILSLSGSFIPTDSGGTKSRTGGMSVSLASPDGRVLGGGLAGLLVAAGPVHVRYCSLKLKRVVIASFLHGYQQEHNPSKQKFEVAPPFSPIFGNHTSGYASNGVFSEPKSNFAPSYHGNNLIFGNSGHGSKIIGNENGTS